MKTNLIFLIAISFLIISCGSSDIRFLEPQPNNTKVLKVISKKFQGNYSPISKTDFIGYFDFEYPYAVSDGFNLNLNNTLKITENAILNTLEGKIVLDFKTAGDSIEKSQYPKHDIIDSIAREQYKRANYSYKLISDQDSVQTFEFTLTDTMFCISNNNVLKKYKNNLYVNIEEDKDVWALYQLKLSDRFLSLKSLSDEDVKDLNSILKKNDEVSDIEVLSPSKKSFKEFVNTKGFEREIVLKKQ